MDAEVFIINISPRNWQACIEKKIFGTRVNAVHHRVQQGDLFLVRRISEFPKGCFAIWQLDREEKVSAETEIPWDDGEYAWKQYFNELTRFRSVFSEEFGGVSRYSEKTGLSAGRIIGAMIHLTQKERAQYILALITEKSLEIPDAVKKELSRFIELDYPKEAPEPRIDHVREGNLLQTSQAARNLAASSDLGPLRISEDGVARIASTRVTLDTLVGAFEDGSTPEEIVQQYPALQLSDIYVVIGFYLRHREDVHEYLREREAYAASVRRLTEERSNPLGVRARLLARQNRRVS